MFGDLAQSIDCRRLVRAHDRYWMICYALNSTMEELKDGIQRKRFAIAAPCDQVGTVALPASLQLIQFTHDDFVTEEQLARLRGPQLVP